MNFGLFHFGGSRHDLYFWTIAQFVNVEQYLSVVPFPLSLKCQVLHLHSLCRCHCLMMEVYCQV